MTSVTVTADVADFSLPGPTPRLAYVTVARVALNSSSGVIVSTAPESVRLIDGHGLLTLEPGVPYRVRVIGVAGLTDPFYASTTVACTLAQLRDSHQLDPSTLNPATPVPQTIAQQLADLAAQVAAVKPLTVTDNGDGTATLAAQ